MRLIVNALIAKPKLNLTVLNLSDNLITSAGCKLVCSLVDKARYLDDLQLQNNDIDNVGAQRLVESLKKRRVAALNIDNNSVSG